MIPTIVVLGDHFEDVYWIGSATRLSPEAPIPVVSITETKSFPGGAGNVENNLRVLGAEVGGVHHSSPAIKNRLIVDGHHLARWDQWDTQAELSAQQIRRLVVDGIIISDYNKGAITYEVVEAIAAKGLPTFIDTKRDPRFFDIIMNPIFFPNSKEYTAYLEGFCVQPKVVLKRGELGMQYQEFGKVLYDYPSTARRVVSVCGAGDTVVAAFAYGYLVGLPDPLAFANDAAAVVVGKPYTATASMKEIQNHAC